MIVLIVWKSYRHQKRILDWTRAKESAGSQEIATKRKILLELSYLKGTSFLTSPCTALIYYYYKVVLSEAVWGSGLGPQFLDLGTR
jgi:hypothetical protein